jgi:DNA-binding protein HU-beta
MIAKPLKRLPTKAAAKVETLPVTKAVPQSASKSAGKAATKGKPAPQVAANVKPASKGRVQAPVKAVPVAASRKAAGGATPKTTGSTATRKAAPAVVAATVTATLKTLAEKFGEKHTLPKKQAGAMVADLFDMVLTHIRSGDRVKIAGLGIIEVKDRPARMGRNPATGEAVRVKASKKVVLRVAKDLKQAI